MTGSARMRLLCLLDILDFFFFFMILFDSHRLAYGLLCAVGINLQGDLNLDIQKENSEHQMYIG